MPVTAIVIIAAIVMFTVELLAPGRSFPKVAGWWWRAALLNGIQIGSVYLTGVTWDRWLPGHSLFNGAALGDTGGAIVGYLAITFIYYWWHRWRHEIGILWRWFHQVHHSPQRIEIITSFYKHPFEILVNGLLSSAILYALVGVSTKAATIAVLVTGVAELFYHWNVKTPYWIGFFFQRPESHCVHHQEHLHKFNYSDIPLWDQIFGTFHNPKTFENTCGFGQDLEPQLREMLMGNDIYDSEMRAENSGQD